MAMLWVRATVAVDPEETGPYESIGEDPSDYVRSGTHETAGLTASSAIQRLDSSGNPSGSGSIGMLGIGMSNAYVMFDKIKSLHNNDARRQPGSKFINGAKYGQTAEAWRDTNHVCWTEAATKVTQAGFTAAQIQLAHVVMIQKRVDIYGELTQAALDEIFVNLLTKYPNIKVIYLSGLNYTGYSANPATGNTTLAPEPSVYNASILMGNLVAADHDFGATGVWTDFYDLWADGVNVSPTTGLSYLVEDVDPDGVHPSIPTGQTKMAESIVNRWKADPVMVGAMFTAA